MSKGYFCQISPFFWLFPWRTKNIFDILPSDRIHSMLTAPAAMCEENILFDWALRALWTLLFLTGGVLNMTVIYCVVRKTPKELRLYSYFILYQAVVEGILCLSTWLLIPRLVGIFDWATYTSLGLASFLGPRFGHIMLITAVSTTFSSILLIPTCFCYRLYVLKHEIPDRKVVLFVLVIITTPLCYNMVFTFNEFVAGGDMSLSEVCKPMAKEVFGIRAAMTNGERFADFFILLWPPGLLISMFTGWKIMHTVRLATQANSRTWAKVNRGIVLALAFQSCVPIVGIIYGILLGLWQAGILQDNYSTSLGIMIFGLIPLLNGFITLYFIPYYRNATFKNMKGFSLAPSTG